MKKRKIALNALVAIVIISIIIFVSNRERTLNHDLPGILKSGRLSVLIDGSQMGFYNSGDSVSGFQYEIVKAFADSLGLELVITEEKDLQKCFENIKTGDYDLIANFIPVTTEWQNIAIFSSPLFTTRQVLIQRIINDSLSSKQINRQTDLANDSIYIQYHSPHKLRLKNLSNEIADSIKIFEVKDVSQEQLVQYVSEGKIKYTICDQLLAKKLQKQYTNIDVSVPIGFEQQLSWAVYQKSPLLLEKLNSFLKDFIGSSAYWEIYRKYY